MKTNRKTSVTRIGRKPLPADRVKESVYVGLTAAEIEALDWRCWKESKASGIDITRSELLRKAWLEYESRRGGMKENKDGMSVHR